MGKEGSRGKREGGRVSDNPGRSGKRLVKGGHAEQVSQHGFKS